MPLIKNLFSRSLSDSAVAKFKEIIPIKFQIIRRYNEQII